MDIFRAGDEGVRRVRESDPDAVRDAGMALLRGGAFAVDGYEMYPVARRDVDGGFGMVAVDREGDVVLLEFRTDRATGATVGDALADAAAASRVDYAALNEWDEQLTGSTTGLAARHAKAFDRDRLDPTAFNDDQRMLLFAPDFDEDLSAAADFLRSKRVGVHPVTYTAYADGDDHIIAFDPLTPIEPDRAEPEPAITRSAADRTTDSSDDTPTVDLSASGRPAGSASASDAVDRTGSSAPDIGVVDAGGGSSGAPPQGAAADPTPDSTPDPTPDPTADSDAESDSDEYVTARNESVSASLGVDQSESAGRSDTNGTPATWDPDHTTRAEAAGADSAVADSAVADSAVADSSRTGGSDAASGAPTATDSRPDSESAPDGGAASISTGEDAGAVRQPDATPLLEAAYERLTDRLQSHFEGDVEELLSLEPNTDEVLLRPDHPAYAGGVLRYRLHPSGERAAAEFRLDVYGGSEVEKERMRAVLRRYEADLEDELGYDVDDGYDAAVRSKPLHVADDEFDPSEARAVAEEFEQLVGFVHPRVMRAWREATE